MGCQSLWVCKLRHAIITQDLSRIVYHALAHYSDIFYGKLGYFST